MPYLHYLCLFADSGVQHILCCVFVCFSSSCVPYVGMSHSFFLWNKGLIHAQCQNNTSTGILYHFIFWKSENPFKSYNILSFQKFNYLCATLWDK